MRDVLAHICSSLSNDGFEYKEIVFDRGSALVIENDTVLGFLFLYKDGHILLGNWQEDSESLIRQYSLMLRNSGKKAWNAYLIILGVEEGSSSLAARLAALEEDLSGTRKIVRVGVKTSLDVRDALLPLLSIQERPVLAPLDILSEIRERATELDANVIDAFLSDHDEATVIRALEDKV